MATFNGKDYNLRFTCGACAHTSTIDIDLGDIHDKDNLWDWLQQHSASGGTYTNVLIDIEKIPVRDRTEEQHQVIIKKYGSIRNYILSILSIDI